MARKRVKKGATRKRRLLRLPNSQGELPDEFSPSAEEWGAIAQAYDHALEDHARGDIRQVVNDYLRREYFERNAPFLSDAEDWIKQLDKRVRDLLWSTEKWRGSDDELKFSAALEARLCLVANMKLPLLEGEDKWRTFFEVVADVAQAIKPAREDLKRQATKGFVEGACWNSFVVTLADRLGAHGLPVTVSKSTPKSPEPSPYVRLVRAIQKSLPKESRRYHSTYDATAQAILTARRRKN